jgi:hypothetical protein
MLYIRDIMWEVLKVTLMEKRCRRVILNQVIVHKFERINRITVGNQEFKGRGNSLMNKETSSGRRDCWCTKRE